MACSYITRSNYDHMVQLKVYVDYVDVKPPQTVRIRMRQKEATRRVAYMIVMKDDKITDYKALLQSSPDCPIIQWLQSDAAQGRWTYKFFLNRVLMSFEDKDTAFAFKMRWL